MQRNFFNSLAWQLWLLIFGLPVRFWKADAIKGTAVKLLWLPVLVLAVILLAIILPLYWLAISPVYWLLVGLGIVKVDPSQLPRANPPYRAPCPGRSVDPFSDDDSQASF